MSEDIALRVRKIIADQLGHDVEDVKGDASFKDDLGGDSIDQVEMAMRIEEEFGFEIPDEDAERPQTASAAIAYVTQRMAEGAGVAS